MNHNNTERENLKANLLELWNEYADWNEERCQDRDIPNPTRMLSFEGFIYWLGI